MRLTRRVDGVIGFIGLAILGTALYAFLLEPNAVRTRNLTLYFTDLPGSADGLCIAHISDLHLRRIGARERAVLRIINGSVPDVIVITGDFVSDQRYRNVSLAFLSKLRARLGVWAVQGNWEHNTGWTGNPLRDDLGKLGIRLLINEAEPLELNGSSIWIAGTDDPYLGADRVPDTLNATDGGFTVLLAHSPEILNRLPKGVQLVLSGHTHGGQVRLPLIGAPWARSMGGGYVSGLHRREGTVLYVTNGVGMTVVPARFLCPPEVAYVTLRRGNP